MPDNDVLAGQVNLPRHRGSHRRYTEYVETELAQRLAPYADVINSDNISDAVKNDIREIIESVQDEVEQQLRNGQIGIANATWDP